MNNFEMIKTLTLPEMAEFLHKFSNCTFCNLYLKPKTCTNCKQRYLRPFQQWLEQESEEEYD